MSYAKIVHQRCIDKYGKPYNELTQDQQGIIDVFFEEIELESNETFPEERCEEEE